VTVSGQTGLYHVYGEADILLYIGVSKHFGVRWQQHAQKQPWWNERRRMTVDFYDDREEALDAEALAIFTEQPKYNVLHRKQALRLKRLRPGEVSKSGPVYCGAEDDYGTIAEQCGRAMHAMWHDGYSWGRAMREAIARYGRLPERRPQWTLTRAAQKAARDNWGPRDACSLCQQGFGRMELPPPREAVYGTAEYEEMVHGTSPLAGGD
jgi:predicted GIY-YIG superfamily endonuclease